jgi:predicted dehydrogenase
VCAAIHASPNAEIVAACDVNPNLAADICRRFGGQHTDQLNALLSDANVDAVYVAVPHDLLAPLARQALLAGKHALVEKPMALTLADADDLIALADAEKLALGVFYEMRYAASFAQARDLLRAGAIGEVISVRIHTLIDKPASYWQAGWGGRTHGPWRGQKARAGGGVVLMNSSHFLDATWFVTGLEVAAVSGAVATLVAPVEVEDTAAATLRYDNGALGSLYSGAHVAGAEAAERCEVFGTEGQMLLPDPYHGGKVSVFTRRPWRDLPPNCWITLPAEDTPVYERALEAFAQAAMRGEPAPIGGRDARRVLATVLALYQSSAEGREVRL